jgi:histidine kinase
MMDKTRKTLYENDNSLIFLEENTEGNQVIRKILRKEESITDKILRYRNEFEYTSQIDLPGVRKAIKIENFEGKSSLVLEYIEGETFYQHFVKKSKSIEQIIEAFIDITQTIVELHKLGIIHRDINSKNILWQTAQNKAVLIDFDMASKFDSQINSFNRFEIGRSNLNYIAPEQTGRVNRKVDSRTDLYSLGITFFELFTGKLPFQSDDPLELIHFHLAKEIPIASQFNKEVPEMISRILTKLMAKNAEDRYQTAYGLYSDLVKCQNEYSKTRKIEQFNLGQDDNSGKLLIPQKLYGRYEEIKNMLKSF